MPADPRGAEESGVQRLQESTADRGGNLAEPPRSGHAAEVRCRGVAAQELVAALPREDDGNVIAGQPADGVEGHGGWIGHGFFH